MKVQKLLVVGTGTMGGGIAQVAAHAGDTVLLYDATPSAAERARNRIGKSLARALEKGYVTPSDIERTLSNLHPISSLEEAAEVDAVIEAVKEELEIKRKVFADLEALVSGETFLWSNTSMISLTEIARDLRHPGRMAGTHFFNPVPRMQLVEIIAGKYTAEATLLAAEATMARWGKTPVRAPDSPGFIVNRLLDAFLREALVLHGEGVGIENIDTAIRLGLNFPMGPMELMDLVGLDTVHDCLLSQAKGVGRSTNPADYSTRLVELVQAGKLGRKSGEGFYANLS